MEIERLDVCTEHYASMQSSFHSFGGKADKAASPSAEVSQLGGGQRAPTPPAAADISSPGCPAASAASPKQISPHLIHRKITPSETLQQFLSQWHEQNKIKEKG